MNGKISRRDFFALSGVGLAGATIAPAFPAPQGKLYAYVSSWTKGPGGAGDGGGISVFTVNMNDGSLTQVSRTGPEFDSLNGGNLCISPDGQYLYATNERNNLGGKQGAGGGVLAFAINPDDGSLKHLNTQPSMGVDPCFIVSDRTGSRVLVANHGRGNSVVRVTKNNGVPEIEDLYDDGTVAMFVVKPDGSLEPACDVAVFERTHGLDPVSQSNAHAHSVNFDPRSHFAIACDVGADHIYVYRVDPGSRTLAHGKSFATPPGKAPRHSAIHPRLPYFFITNERESSLSSFHFDSKTGEVRPIQTVATVPDGYSGPHNAPADIRLHPNGKFVYGSNRGQDSIAIFKIDETTGQMIPVDIVKTLGMNPREFNFEPSGRYLFVGNLDSNQIVTFAVDPDSGKMTPTGARADLSRPACVHFAVL
jgi:6-phosphogluconolactonase